MIDNLPNGLYDTDLDHIFGGGETEEKRIEREQTESDLEDAEVDYLRGEIK